MRNVLALVVFNTILDSCRVFLGHPVHWFWGETVTRLDGQQVATKIKKFDYSVRNDTARALRGFVETPPQ